MTIGMIQETYWKKLMVQEKERGNLKEPLEMESRPHSLEHSKECSPFFRTEHFIHFNRRKSEYTGRVIEKMRVLLSGLYFS